MTLKVLGAGYHRTGTRSTYKALNTLGFPCYHMFEATLNPNNWRHVDFWCDVAEAPAGTQHDWEKVFAGYAAAVDDPASSVWQELMAAYPDAKVVLTLHPRGAEVWFDSVINTVYFTEVRWQFKVLALFVPHARKTRNMIHKLIWQRAHRGTMPDRAKAVADYERHAAEVKARVPPEKLLVYSVDQGWEPLCRFLDVPVPSVPFPKANDRAAFKRMIGLLDCGAYAILAAIAIAAAGAVYGLANLISA